MKSKRYRARKNLISSKIRESFTSVFPITLIVLILSITISPIDSSTFLAFIVGAFLVTVGVGFFTLGADASMTRIGSYVSKTVIKSKKLWIIMPVFFLLGMFITISEPDLQLLACQLSGTIDKWTLLITVGVGVGVFLVIGFLRIILKIKFSILLIVLYIGVFVLSYFVPSSFVPIAFDSGGVTTGPMTVPFIIAIGTGVAEMRSDKGAEEDGFGLTALCSIGPIIAVMILGIIFKPESFNNPSYNVATFVNSKEMVGFFLSEAVHYLKEVAISLLPIVVFFLISLIFGSRLTKAELIKIFTGLVYVFIGLVLFLLGANGGFSSIGYLLGKNLAVISKGILVVPVGVLLGYFVVSAEPAVHVLTAQVFEVTDGAISKKALRISLMIAVGISVGLALLRILVNVSVLYFLIPGYVIALVLTFFTPDIFTAVAFDAGGVASGAMTACFTVPFALGVCTALEADVALFGYGVVAMVAMIPLVTIQIFGLVFRIKKTRLQKRTTEKVETTQTVKETIID